jgi:nucleoside-triphosphatase THEP1
MTLQYETKNDIIFLTGGKGAGKSTVCIRAAELAKKRGYSCAGIASPALFDENGEKIGFQAEDLATGWRWVLGHRTRRLKGPRYGPFRFSAKGFRKAVRSVRRSLRQGSDLFVLDEIGPLELERGGGFFPLLEPLYKERNAALLLVVRPSLLDAVRAAVQGRRTCVLDTDPSGRDRLPERILELLGLCEIGQFTSAE